MSAKFNFPKEFISGEPVNISFTKDNSIDGIGDFTNYVKIYMDIKNELGDVPLLTFSTDNSTLIVPDVSTLNLVMDSSQFVISSGVKKQALKVVDSNNDTFTIFGGTIKIAPA